MTGELASEVTVVGSLVERPTFSENEVGEPLAHFWIQHGSNRVWCVCHGAVAENVRTFATAGVEVLAHGRLDWLHGQAEQPHVLIDRLGFVNPTELSELTEHLL